MKCSCSAPCRNHLIPYALIHGMAQINVDKRTPNIAKTLSNDNMMPNNDKMTLNNDKMTLNNDKMIP